MNFFTLPNKYCLEVSKQVFEKSRNKYEEAIILSEKGRYDTASTLLIVSHEESIKGLILFLDGNGFRIRKIKGVRGIFNNHKLRYLLALSISLMSMFTKEMSTLLMKIMSGDSTFLDKIDPNQEGSNERIKIYLTKALSNVKKEIDFFSKVDKARQQGLYSDYENGLIQITEGEYNELFSKITLLNNLIDSFSGFFSSDEEFTKEYIGKLKIDFNNIYAKKLEVLLEKINSPKVNSYESLMEIVNDMKDEIDNISDFNLNGDNKSFSKLLEQVRNAKTHQLQK